MISARLVIMNKKRFGGFRLYIYIYGKIYISTKYWVFKQVPNNPELPTLGYSHVAIEIPPSMDDFPIKPSIWLQDFPFPRLILGL